MCFVGDLWSHAHTCACGGEEEEEEAEEEAEEEEEVGAVRGEAATIE